MKTLFRFAALCCMISALGFTSCQKFNFEDEEVQTSSRTFTFSLFTPSASRASSIADFKKIVVMDIVDGNIKQVIQQASSDNGFGSPSITLENGTHTLRFIATDAEGVSFNGSTLSQSPLGDTFVQTVTLNTKEAETNQRVVLGRNVARIIYEGENSVTVSGILFSFDLLQYEPVGESTSFTLEKDGATYSLIPASGFLMLADNTKVPVKANAVTVIKDDGSEVDTGDNPTEGELLVLTNDTAQFYVPKLEITNITLSTTPDPIAKYGNQIKPYRVPTRIEAAAMRRYVLPSDYWSGARCLCYDRPEDYRKVGSTEYGTGKYYTFTWADSNTGGTTVAGEKTKYSIKPVRAIPIAPIKAQFSLDADFTWDADTMNVSTNK